VKQCLKKRNIGGKNVTITLDNASIHLTKLIKKTATNFDFRIMYLPPYTPMLAPVEQVFEIIKSKIRASNRRETADFSKESGQRLILEAMNTLSGAMIQKVWMKFVKQAKLYIVEDKSITNERGNIDADEESKVSEITI
jgi:hypothetical protein